MAARTFVRSISAGGSGGLSTALKYTVGRSRPSVAGDPDQFRPFTRWNSFPSGHTAVAFAIATAVADETRDPWTDAALYEKYGITPDEQAFIESMIRPMEATD